MRIRERGVTKTPDFVSVIPFETLSLISVNSSLDWLSFPVAESVGGRRWWIVVNELLGA